MLKDKLLPFLERYNELSTLLSDPNIATDIKKMTALSKEQSSLEKIKNRLWKHYMYFKRKTGVELENVMEPTDMRNMNHIADELMLMEKTSFNTEVLFGAAPILYRGR